jgi:tetratricopeptide (TPR) repeat protein
MALGLVVEALGLANHTWEFYRKRKQAHVEKLYRLLNEARAASGPEAEALLTQACEEAARRLEKKPQDAHALHQWGVALWWRAAKASRSEADHIYEQADGKFVQSQAIAPNDAACCADRVGAMLYRAALHTGDKGRRLRLQICELCRKRVGIVWSGPYDARTFHTWGSALWWVATSETGEEAKRLYKEASEKFARAVALDPRDGEFAVDQADVLAWRAALYSGDEQREMLQRVCQQCQQLACRGIGGARMLAIWAGALRWLGSAAKGEEAERFYAEAEKIAARAWRIAPDSARAACGLAGSLTYHALQQRGEERRETLARLCEQCTRFDKVHPRDANVMLSWGTALIWRASAAINAEADGLFAEAAETLTLGLSVRPADDSLRTSLAVALGYRARLLGGEAARPLVLRAGELLEGVLTSNPANYQALAQWASLSHVRARLMPGEETTRVAAEVVRRFKIAARNGADPDAILRGWGTAVWALAKCVDGEESALLLAEAKAKLLESETRVPDSATYPLAVICAQTGDLEECRRWLRASGEPGGNISRDWLETEEDLAPVRDTEWFRQLLAGQAA